MALALLAVSLPLALYLATLQPGFGGPEDTPKFQFLGYVLGTAHPPGYPLYVMLSHLFVKLPVGTIAYRANLFSAVLAAICCGLCYGLAREIGSSRWPAFCVALALATGASFWQSAVFAEVYSLAAVIAALSAALLLRWSATRRKTFLLAATLVLALGLGNHLTVVGLAPAFIAFVVIRDPRAVTWKLVLAVASIVALGLSQYLFVLVRTWQGAPYLESRADTLVDLVGVMMATRFSGARFAFGASELWNERVPAVLAIVGEDLGPLGVAAVSAGALAALVRRNAGGWLLAGAAGGTFAIVVNLSGDLRGFVTPLLPLLWPLGARGFDAAAGVASGVPLLRPIALVFAAAAAAAMPLLNVQRNYEAADQSGEIGTAGFLRAIYAQLPDRAAMVAEDYPTDMGFQYFAFTGEGGPNRDFRRIGFGADAVRDAARGGRRVFALARASTFFAADGLRFERTPLEGPTLGEWLETLPRGTVLVAASAFTPVPIELSHPARSPSPDGLRDRTFSAAAVLHGTSKGSWRTDDAAVSLAVDATGLGTELPGLAGLLSASAGERGASIELAGRVISSIDRGVAVAVFDAGGALVETFTLREGVAARVPLRGALYQLRGEMPCADLSTRDWTDITAVLPTGSWVTSFSNVGTVAIDVEMEPGARALVRELLGAGTARLENGPTGTGRSNRASIELSRPGERRPVYRFALDRAPARARARLTSGASHVPSLRVCGQAPPALFQAGDDATLRPDFESEAYFGPGWEGAERSPTGHIRRGSSGATLLLPLTPGRRYRVLLDLRGPADARLEVRLDEARIGDCVLQPGQPCTVTLTPGSTGTRASALTISVDGYAGTGSSEAPLIFLGARILRLGAGPERHRAGARSSMR